MAMLLTGGVRVRFGDLRLTAEWYVRGGIYTTVVVEQRKKGWKAPPAVTLP